jgi:hypothetical protein
MTGVFLAPICATPTRSFRLAAYEAAKGPRRATPQGPSKISEDPLIENDSSRRGIRELRS